MEVTTEKLFQVIGEQAVELMLLRGQLAEARGQLQNAAAEVNGLRAELAAAHAALDAHEEVKSSGP